MRRSLQIVLGILSLIPVLVSVLGLAMGAARLLPGEVVTPAFDSHYRYIAGYYLSLAMISWYIIPNVERHTALFRILCAGVFVGGLGRLISIIQVGVPGTSAIVFTAFELLFPLLAVWQARLPRTAQHLSRDTSRS